jgi:hypothetical protein
MRRSLFSVVLVSLTSLSLSLCTASGLHDQTFSLQTGREPAEPAKQFGQNDDITVLTLTLTPPLKVSLA